MQSEERVHRELARAEPRGDVLDVRRERGNFRSRGGDGGVRAHRMPNVPRQTQHDVAGFDGRRTRVGGDREADAHAGDARRDERRVRDGRARAEPVREWRVRAPERRERSQQSLVAFAFAAVVVAAFAARRAERARERRRKRSRRRRRRAAARRARRQRRHRARRHRSSDGLNNSTKGGGAHVRFLCSDPTDATSSSPLLPHSVSPTSSLSIFRRIRPSERRCLIVTRSV
mmetsp:Transcript_6163/g.22574  ORF Transcript_6163/g.22574 Transcript_6163/m.22574 type:complete len:230 (+) Transcript_6163:444-1133(+)